MTGKLQPPAQPTIKSVDTTGSEFKSKSEVTGMPPSSSSKRYDQGFISHTAARASAKRGFFKENGGTASAALSIKSSTANLAITEQHTLQTTQESIASTTKITKQRSMSKSKKPRNKTATQQPGLSQTGKHKTINAFTSAELLVGSSPEQDSSRHKESSSSLKPPLKPKAAESHVYQSG